MTTGVTCPKCGLMQLPRPSCKACGATLGAALLLPSPLRPQATTAQDSSPPQTKPAPGARKKNKPKRKWIKLLCYLAVAGVAAEFGSEVAGMRGAIIGGIIGIVLLISDERFGWSDKINLPDDFD